MGEIARLQGMKTGALFSFSVEAGARLAGVSPGASAALVACGRAIGAAFQIADDILDAEGDAAALGKRAGKDAARNKPTLVAALGLEGARRELARLVDEAKAAAESSEVGAAGDVLRATAEFVAARKS
jgi:farnesyl diphosphate synthase